MLPLLKLPVFFSNLFIMKSYLVSIALVCSATVAVAADAPSAETAEKGLQAALTSLVSQATSTANDGKTAASELSVPLPDKLAKLETILRNSGQGQLVDDFKAKLKEVALKSLPDSVKALTEATGKGGVTIDDPLTVLKTGPDGLTNYVKQKTRPPIIEKVIPAVKTNSKVAGLAASYQAMVAKAGPMASTLFGKQLPSNIDQYVAEQTVDYSYTLMGKSEGALRANPSLAKNALVKKVFESVQKK